jgi:Domain of unknown function (DUF1902)
VGFAAIDVEAASAGCGQLRSANRAFRYWGLLGVLASHAAKKHSLPFSRDKRAVVYQRAKNVLDKRPFGTQYDVYADNFEWLRHSVAPRPHASAPFRVTIGGPDCARPYCASIFNRSCTNDIIGDTLADLIKPRKALSSFARAELQASGLAPVAPSEYTWDMSNSSITVKVAWDPEAKVFYTEYTDLLGLNLEAETLEEFREKLPCAIQELTGRQVPCAPRRLGSLAPCEVASRWSA